MKPLIFSTSLPNLLTFTSFYIHCSISLAQTEVSFPGSANGKELACQCKRLKRFMFDLWVRKILWRRAWQRTPVFFPRESNGQRSLADCSPWGHIKSLTLMKQLGTYRVFAASCNLQQFNLSVSVLSLKACNICSCFQRKSRLKCGTFSISFLSKETVKEKTKKK